MKPNLTSFSTALSERAEAYFSELRHHKYATTFGLTKSVFFLLLFFAAYYYFVFKTNSFASALVLAMVLGICHVLIPVNISHDAIHGSIAKSKLVNHLGKWCMELTGASSSIYSRKHLEAHFNKENGTLVNNISLQGLLLQKKEKASTKNLPYVFYIFYSQYMIFVRDFFLLKESNEEVALGKYAKLWIGKILYAAFLVLLPFLFIPLPWWQVLTALLLMYFIITVLLVVILLMPTEKMETNKTDDDHGKNDQWIIEILAHNVDFSPASRLLNYVVGGANLNVVHYLFPTVNHTHYNKLAGIIERTAKEYGVIYRKQEVKDVLGIHFNYLKNIQHTNTEAPNVS